MNEDVIFDCTREDWQYKGVVFAEMDNSAIDNETGMKSPKDYVAGFMALI